MHIIVCNLYLNVTMTSATDLRVLQQENVHLQLQILELQQLLNLQQRFTHQYHELAMHLMSAVHFEGFAQALFVTATELLMLDHITLVLVDEDHRIQRLLNDLHIPLSLMPSLVFVAETTEKLYPHKHNAPFFTPFEVHRHGHLIQDHQLQHLAVLPITKTHISGYLCLGSYQQNYFEEEQNTLLINELALLIGTCLENVINNTQLQHQGYTDTLTHLYNRRYLNQRLTEEVARAEREKTDIALLYMDVDFFKQINDTYGHLNGDIVLAQTSEVLRQSLRLSDVLGRYGGEEFVAILPKTSIEEALIIAERVRQCVSETHTILSHQTQSIQVTVSIGVSTLQPEHHFELETATQELISQADQALYRAKSRGRNSVVCYKEPATLPPEKV